MNVPISPNNTYSTLISYPVVREVFVDNLSHLGLLCDQDARGEVQADVEHGCLIGQSGAAVFRKWVGRHLR